MAVNIAKTYNDSNKWYQILVLLDGTNDTITLVDVSSAFSGDLTAGANTILSFMEAKWCISGPTNASVAVRFSANTPQVFLNLGPSATSLKAEQINSHGAGANGDVQIVTANAPVGWIVLTFKKGSGFAAIDADYHSSEYPSMPALP